MTLEFPVLLRLIDERSFALRAAVASAPRLEAQVPTCPEWTLLDLVQHLGNSHRRWAATVAAGPADAPPDETIWKGAPATAFDCDALLSWSAASTEQLLSALRSPARIAAAGRGGSGPSRRRPVVPSPGTSSSTSRCTRTTHRSPSV